MEKTGGGGEMDKNGAQEGVSSSSSSLETETQAGVSAVLVLKALCESKMALLFWPFQLI